MSSSSPTEQQSAEQRNASTGSSSSPRSAGRGVTHESRAMRNFQVAATIAHGLAGCKFDANAIPAPPREPLGSGLRLHDVGGHVGTVDMKGQSFHSALTATRAADDDDAATASGTRTRCFFRAQPLTNDQEQDQRPASLAGRPVVQETDVKDSNEPTCNTPAPNEDKPGELSPSGDKSSDSSKPMDRRERRSTRRRSAQDEALLEARRRTQQGGRRREGLRRSSDAGSSTSRSQRTVTRQGSALAARDGPGVLHVETMGELKHLRLRSATTKIEPTAHEDESDAHAPRGRPRSPRRVAFPDDKDEAADESSKGVTREDVGDSPLKTSTPIRRTYPAPSKDTFTFESTYKLPLGSKPAATEFVLRGRSRSRDVEPDEVDPALDQERPPTKARRKAKLQSPSSASSAHPKGSEHNTSDDLTRTSAPGFLGMLEEFRAQLAGCYRQGIRFVTIARTNMKVEILNTAGDAKALGFVVPLSNDFSDWSDDDAEHRVPSEPDYGSDNGTSDSKGDRPSSSELEPQPGLDAAPGMTRDEDSHSTLAPVTPGPASPLAGSRRRWSHGAGGIAGVFPTDLYRHQPRILNDSDGEDDENDGGPRPSRVLHFRNEPWQSRKRTGQHKKEDETSPSPSDEQGYMARHIPQGLRQAEVPLHYDEELPRHDLDRGALTDDDELQRLTAEHQMLQTQLMGRVGFLQAQMAAAPAAPSPPPSPRQSPLTRQQRRHQHQQQQPQFGSRWREKRREIIPSNRPKRVEGEIGGLFVSDTPAGSVLNEEAPLRKYSSTDHSSLPRDKMARNLRARQTAPRIFQREEGVDRLRLLLDAPPEEREKRRPWGRKALEAGDGSQQDEEQRREADERAHAAALALGID